MNWRTHLSSKFFNSGPEELQEQPRLSRQRKRGLTLGNEKQKEDPSDRQLPASDVRLGDPDQTCYR